MTTLGCTGHRPDRLGGYSADAHWRLVQVALDYLQETSPDAVITGMALGWDQAFAVAARNLGIPFVAAVPFEGQERMWPESSRTGYRILLDQASHIHVVSPGPYAAWKMHRRNEWIVDNCDRLAAMWDGQERGGTWECVKYARSVERPVDELFARWRTT